MDNDCDARPARKAISPLIATVLVTLLTVVALGLTLAVVMPTFSRARDTSVINDEFNTLAVVDTAVKEVASEPDGSRRVVPITITDGMLRTDTTNDWMYFEYTPAEALDLSGTKGIAHIERGLEFADYFGSYADGGTAVPAWTNASGQAVVSSGVYSITNGTSYHAIPTSLSDWQFGATITNVSGVSGGEMFVLPTSASNLVGYWTFDEGSGGYAYDWSGNNNTGTMNYMNNIGNETSGWNASCVSGRCLLFDGFNDYIDAGNASSLNITNTITIAAWIKASDIPAGAIPISYGVYTEGGWYFHIGGSGTNTIDPRFMTSDGDFAINSPAGIFPEPDWNHVVITYDGSNVTIFVNGVSKYAQPVTGTIRPTGYDLFIGKYPTGFNFKGAIDEVMIFNRSLSANEVKALYETSAKKLLATGTQTITVGSTPSIVLSDPAGQTKFDNVVVTSAADDKLTLLVPYDSIDLSGSLRLSKGSYSVQVRHVATNSTTNKPIIELTSV